jgi:hypothetical protein
VHTTTSSFRRLNAHPIAATKGFFWQLQKRYKKTLFLPSKPGLVPRCVLLIFVIAWEVKVYRCAFLLEAQMHSLFMALPFFVA